MSSVETSLTEQKQSQRPEGRMNPEKRIWTMPLSS